ncbi:MAG: hypothetical protein U0R80_10560 [Nocardioidaceae bacterium]
MPTFWDLDEVERAVLDVASEEGLPWEVCATWRPDPASRTQEDIERTRATAGSLVERGWVWMYRIAPGNPDLTRDEVLAVLEHPHAWNYTPTWSHDVAVYLKPDGERIYFGTTSSDPPPSPE